MRMRLRKVKYVVVVVDIGINGIKVLALQMTNPSTGELHIEFVKRIQNGDSKKYNLLDCFECRTKLGGGLPFELS